MRSLYQFIIKPKYDRYNNTKKIGDKELIVNTNIEDHKFISKEAVVVQTPAAFDTDIKPGDEVYVHHNLFRRWYNMRGEEKNSSLHFKDNLYFCNVDQIYMYNNKPHLDYCFVKPIKEIDAYKNTKEREYYGILKYSNSSLERVGLTPGDLVIFTPHYKFEFLINNERLYCLKSNNIAVTHEYKGNEEEYNPSWAKSR